MIQWDERPYSTGLDRGVLYLDNTGVPWNGLVSTDEVFEQTNESDAMFGGIRYSVLRDAPDPSFRLEAFTYPDDLLTVLEETVTSEKKLFGLSYRILRENGYEIHILYNAFFNPPSHEYQSGSDIFDPSPFDWEVEAVPVHMPGFKPSAHFVIRTADTYAWTVRAIESLLYGSGTTPAYLPTVYEMLNLFEENSIVRVINNNDGTYTVTGPDEAIQFLDDGLFEITWDSVAYINDYTYTISSL